MITLQLHLDKLPDDSHEIIERLLQEKLNILNKYIRTYTKPITLQVTGEQTNSLPYILTLRLYFNSHVLNVKRGAKTPSKALEVAFTTLKETFLQQFEKQTKEQVTLSREDRSVLLNQAIGELAITVKTGDIKAFSRQLLPLLADLQRHISRRIQFAQGRGIIERHSILPEDIVEETVAKAYDQFEDKPENLTLEQWVYHLANTILNKELKEEHLSETTLESWEQEVDKENNIERNLVVDYEFEPFLSDPLLDPDKQLPSYKRTQEYIGMDSDTFQHEENRERLREVVSQLSTLPLRMRTVFDLFVFSGFDEEDIAAMQGISKHDVGKIIREVRDQLKKRLASK